MYFSSTKLDEVNGRIRLHQFDKFCALIALFTSFKTKLRFRDKF